MTKTSRAMIGLLAICGLAIPLGDSAVADQSKQVDVSDVTFHCLAQMTPVRGFFVANLLGNLSDTLRVANSPTGGRYPPGSAAMCAPGPSGT